MMISIRRVGPCPPLNSMICHVISPDTGILRLWGPRSAVAAHSGSANAAPLVCVELMAFADVSLTALRVFREVAERGTLTAAAAALGYTQSAVSRQIAALERVLAEEG
jgi:hypothetical protein